MTTGKSTTARWRRPAGASGGLLALAGVLLVSVLAALSVPAGATLAGYPGAALAAGGRVAGGVEPVSSRYVNARLGGGLGLPSSGSVRPGGSSSQGSRRTSSRTPRAAAGSPTASASTTRPSKVTVTHGFTNDAFEHAYAIPSLPFTGTTNPTGESRQGQEPTSCSGLGGTEWYGFVAPDDEGISVDTFGTDHAVALAVFTGDAIGSLKQVGCSTSTSGNAQVGVSASKGTRYYVQVTGLTAGSKLVLSVTPIGPTEQISVNDKGETSQAAVPNLAATSDVAQASVLSNLPRDSSFDGRYYVFSSSATNLDPTHPVIATCPPRNFNDALFLSAGLTAAPCFQMYVRDRRLGTTRMISGPVDGPLPPDGLSAGAASISADGRFVVFQSESDNLVPGDTNNTYDVFLLDRSTGTLTRESVGPEGEQTQEPAEVDQISGSGEPVISADGRTLAFISDAQNFGRSTGCSVVDIHECEVLYVKDLPTGRLTPVLAPDGSVPQICCPAALALSSDGRLLVFSQPTPTFGEDCTATTLSSTCSAQIYLFDSRTAKVTCLSCPRPGTFGDADTDPTLGCVSLSSDDRYIAFPSRASNLVAGDTNGVEDVFVLDRTTGGIVRASVGSDGRQAAAVAPTTSDDTLGQVTSGLASTEFHACAGISGDGHRVVFSSPDTTLTSGGNSSDQQEAYVHDLTDGSTTRVSVSSTGAATEGRFPGISGDGRTVFFQVRGSGPDGDNKRDLFAHTLTELDR